jgi:hypothetical protein
VLVLVLVLVLVTATGLDSCPQRRVAWFSVSLAQAGRGRLYRYQWATTNDDAGACMQMVRADG